MLTLPKTENSYWLDNSSLSAYPELIEDTYADVAIVGGGISGLTAAYLLKKAGKSVIVLEKDMIACGTTGNTTGKVTSQHNLIYSDLANQLGEETARLYGQANETALHEIEKLIKNENIKCDFHKADNYVYTTKSENVKKFHDEAGTAKRLGLSASYESTIPLPFDVVAAVRFADQAYFNSAKYCAGLAEKITGGRSSGFIFEDTRALSIHDGHSPKVRTKSGTLHAKQIVVATNVPTFPLLARGGFCVLEYPQKSYIVAAKTKKKIDGMFISPDENEYSILPIGRGKDKMLLIGGESHIRGVKLNKNSRYQRLADYAQQRFGATSIEYKWSAWDYQSYDNIPLAGKMYPWSKNLYVISAFRKWGLTNSMVAGTIIRDLICGEQNEWADVYNPARSSPIKSIPHVAKQYVFG
jgi:glycine/D-amino acid oxidase-like deaminating enzyme